VSRYSEHGGAEYPDKETADLTASNLAKANKIKLAEDRHKQNIEALTNLQKAVVSISQFLPACS
jgi:hypothetical protein